MDKIIRYRCKQNVSLDDFVENILKHPKCKYCVNHDECQELMGLEDIEEELGIYGCAAFDNTVEGLTELYLKDFSVEKSTTTS